MKKYLLSIGISILVLSISTISVSFSAANETEAYIASEAKLEIKIKNDTDDEVSVINDGSGGTYRLSKNVVTTLKMEAGDKLYTYVKGKNDVLLLTASANMEGKVQLLSKL